MKTRKWVNAVFALIACLTTADSMFAAVTFTKIAESTNFYGSPAINNAGTVAFVVTNGQTFATAVNVGNGGPVGTIATSTTSVGALGTIHPLTHPSINNNGVVAFQAFFNTGTGIFSGSGGPLTTISTTTTPISIMIRPSINASGTVAFYYEDTLSSGIYAGNGSAAAAPLVTSAHPTFSQFVNLQINDSGNVAFTTYLDGGAGHGIYSTANLASPIAQYPFPGGDEVTNDSILSYNNSGVAVFAATGLLGVMQTSTVGGTPVTFLDDSGPFFSFDVASINNLGQLAFLASLDNTAIGIYNGPDPVANKVIEYGDTLFGGHVAGLGIGQEAINDSGQITFSYFLDTGLFGIAVANVPEPTLVSMLIPFASLLISRRRR